MHCSPDKTVSIERTAPIEKPHPLERFFDSFFQQRNIQWMLVVGAAIVFGSSLMLVTKSWADWTLALKCAVVIGYTAAIYGAGQVAFSRLNLKSTARILQGLTLLLLPICFASLCWVGPGSAVQMAGLLVPAIALLTHASTKILDDWLSGRQATFVVSYGLLCLAGALPACGSQAAAMGFLLLAWLVFAAGVVKVNRHVFWLAASHRKSRVFGFLPIAMLGLQFASLVAIKCTPALPVCWFGLGLVLVAVTVLQTARAVADVYAKRTGDLVRPLPWSIVAPLMTGLVLAVVGVAVSTIGFSYVGATTFALIPTAALAAIVFGLVARDTKHPVMVWMTLIAVAAVYQSCPVMFGDVVEAAKSTAAQSINRVRVPLSLYGLTYTPLLIGLVACAGWLRRRGESALAAPVQSFVTVLAVGWFALACTDMTSLFLVATANVITFGIFAIAFADRRYALVSIAALVASAGLVVPAGNQMAWWMLSPQWIGVVLSGVAMAMTISPWADRLLKRISCGDLPTEVSVVDGRWVQAVAAGLTVGMAVHWTFFVLATLPASLTTAVVIQWAMLVLTLGFGIYRWPNYASGAAFWGLVAIAAVRFAIGVDVHVIEIAMGATPVLVSLSLVAFLLVRGIDRGANRWSIDAGFGIVRRRVIAMALPLFDLSLVAVTGLTFGFFMPVGGVLHLFGTAGNFVDVNAFAILAVLVTIWWLAVARQPKHQWVSSVAATLPPVAVSTVLIAIGFELTPGMMGLAWAATQAIAMLVYRKQGEACEGMFSVAGTTMVMMLAASCVSFDWSMRAVALIAIASRSQRSASTLMLANVHVLLAVAATFGCEGWIVSGLMRSMSPGLIAAELLAISVSMLTMRLVERFTSIRVSTWTICLQSAAVVLTVGCFAGNETSLAIVSMVVSSLAILAGLEMTAAIAGRSEWRVWSGIAVSLAATGYLWLAGVISFGIGISQFVLLGLGVTALVVMEFSRTRDLLSVLTRPMNQIGLAMPAVVSGLALVRQFTDLMAGSTALGAMALMVASGIYFHRVIVGNDRRFLIPAVAIANLGVVFLWHLLGWNAIELYLVPIGLSVLGILEVFRDRVPATSHTPIRSAALLLILGSPLFQVLGGSWIHMLVLMGLSVVVILAAIGLRLRWLMFTASACLAFDLVAMVVRSTMHNLNVLWIVGVLIGIGVIAIAAVCENHRDKLLQRIRLLSSELATWN